MSALEHEIWQELTGYDAVSTVRGIQMALASGAALLNPKKNASEDTVPAAYSGFGFTDAVPSGFVYTPFEVYATRPATWTHGVEGSEFDTLQRSVDATTSALRRSKATYRWRVQWALRLGLLRQ